MPRQTSPCANCKEPVSHSDYFGKIITPEGTIYFCTKHECVELLRKRLDLKAATTRNYCDDCSTFVSDTGMHNADHTIRSVLN